MAKSATLPDGTRTFTDSIDIARPPQVVYDLVSDVTRTGEWSPVCVGCSWDEGAGPTVGAQFTGRNQTPKRTWETRSTVVAAEPGHEFAWVIGDGFARWGYTLETTADGTRLTESWAFLPAGHARFRELYGERADEQMDERTTAAHEGIPATLAAIKRIAEADAAN